MTETTRKCGECKKLLVLEKDEFVIEKDIYYHVECLVNFLASPKRRKKQNREEVIIYVVGLREESKRRANDIIARERLFKWIQNHYDLVTMPPGIFTRLEAVFSGTYKGMTVPIPPEDVYEIWTRRWNDMVKTYQYNLSIGKVLDNVARVYYDLAIVLSKSTSYFKWKENQRIAQQDTQEQMKKIEINYRSINQTATANLENESDLSSILEEI